MTNAKPLTKSDLVNTLKQMNLATKDDIKTVRKEMATKDELRAVKKVMATKSDIKNIATKDDIKNMATKDDILASERRVKLRMGKIRNDLAGRIANLAVTTPTSKEFKELKGRVEGSYAS